MASSILQTADRAAKSRSSGKLSEGRKIFPFSLLLVVKAIFPLLSLPSVARLVVQGVETSRFGVFALRAPPQESIGLLHTESLGPRYSTTGDTAAATLESRFCGDR